MTMRGAKLHYIDEGTGSVVLMQHGRGGAGKSFQRRRQVFGALRKFAHCSNLPAGSPDLR